MICSIGPVFFAVVPLVLNGLWLSGAPLWRLSSATIGLTEVVVITHLVRQVRSLESGEGRALNYGFVLWLVATASCLANVVGWPWSPNGGLYLLAVWSIVGIAGGNFVELLFRKIL